MDKALTSIECLEREVKHYNHLRNQINDNRNSIMKNEDKIEEDIDEVIFSIDKHILLYTETINKLKL